MNHSLTKLKAELFAQEKKIQRFFVFLAFNDDFKHNEISDDNSVYCAHNSIKWVILLL